MEEQKTYFLLLTAARFSGLDALFYLKLKIILLPYNRIPLAIYFSMKNHGINTVFFPFTC